MEEDSLDVFNPLGLFIIRDDYEKGLECLDRALTADEARNAAAALELYRRGRQHLHRGMGVDSSRPECVGAAWDSARQMQRKMSQTLGNITTRLAALETAPTATPAPELSPAQSLYLPLPTPDHQGASAPTRVPLPGFAPLRVSPTMHPGEQPPAYTPQAADGHLSLSYGTEAGELSLVRDTPTLQSPFASRSASLGLGGEEGQDLLFFPEGVQIFFVEPEGQVSAPSYPGYLRITRLHSQQCPERAYSPPTAVLQVCDWVYPLTPTSPVLLCNSGVFMFPDTLAPTPGSYVGVVLSSELPESDRRLFQFHLAQLTDLRHQAPEVVAEAENLCEKVPLGPLEQTPTLGATVAEKEKKKVEEEEEEVPLPEWSEKVAQGILTGASWLSWGLVKGAEYTEKAIQKGASKLRERITPEDTPTEVSPNVAKGLQVAKQASGGAVRVSQLLVDGVCTVAGHVGRELAPHVKKHGSKLIPESMKKDPKGRSTLDGAKAVAVSSMQGLATVWTGLEVASKNVGKSVATETVSTVKHKYRGLENVLDPPSSSNH
ncbi:spartin a [Conger conger]|uniref:spartin a n=1 Tax=Conger conger TaxID=82655 RepID=UPI002A59B9B0|nr:spartin a [Conger conger]XP_061103485.1 spartin a [Conger conger]XP_061103486.1 spartin a [Conger conger]XP_061103487.1 spartin a [Conger conger]